MFYPIPAHVKFVHRNYIFREIIAYLLINFKLSFYRLLGSKQICYLYVYLLILLFADKIYLPVLYLANRYIEASPQKLKVNDIFQYKIDIPNISPIYGFSDTMVSNIVLFIRSKYLLSLQFLTLYLIKKAGITAIRHIIENGLS